MNRSRDQTPVHAVLENDDVYAHTVTVQAVSPDRVLAETTEYIEPGDQLAVTLNVPATHAGDGVEVVAIPDETADAAAEGVRPPSHSFIEGTVPATTAVTVFAIINGVGGAASQLLAATELANVEAVSTTRAAGAGSVAIIGAIVGSAILFWGQS